ncbi:MAG: SpoIID/LytB domain-containing protein [Bacteroidia bacterium]|nr:SpoIID/LytB domain-containing protein [Bacteroidia bacterium]
MNIFISYILSFLTIVYVHAQTVDISIFSDYLINEVVITPFSGNYTITGDSLSLTKFTVTDIVFVSMLNDSINIKTLEKNLGSFSTVKISGSDSTNNILKIKPVVPGLNERLYNNDVKLSILHGRILILNRVDIEYYIAGVVETEGGSKAGSEYYKTQAIICRTYALENRQRHELEGFELCDGVHCQAYSGCCFYNFDILEATLDTKGLVIVDSALKLITAAFHSNSGGETVNSEDIWILPKPYLHSIKDDFWKNGRNAYWTKSISAEQWKQYLKGYGVSFNDSNITPQSFTFVQNTRMNYYIINGQKLALKNIRSDFKLKSTFFSISSNNEELIFKGRGYGHGVGLSQESAMYMAELGYSYRDIIKYFYKNVYIVNYEALEFFIK